MKNTSKKNVWYVQFTAKAIIAFILFWSIPFLFFGCQQTSRTSEKSIPPKMFTENQMRAKTILDQQL